MKKLILSAFLFGAVYTAQAQTNLSGTAATSRVQGVTATEMTRQMYNDLQLNELQYIKLKSINQTRLDKMDQINKMYSNDAQMRDAKIAEVTAQLDQEYAQVLTPKQFTYYLELEGRGIENKNSMNVSGASSTNASAGSVDTGMENTEGQMKQDAQYMNHDADKNKSTEKKSSKKKN